MVQRFFFDIRDSGTTVDAEGIELATVEEARAEAVMAAGEMLRERGLSFWGAKWEMTVRSEDGQIVCRLWFGGEMFAPIKRAPQTDHAFA